jgi:heat shock protein HslJ
MADSSQLFNVEWQLVKVGGQAAPPGAGDRKATLVFSDSTGRAGGFAGCNGASGVFTLRGDSLSFGPVVSTKMACSQGMDLEQKYIAALGAARAYRMADGDLILLGDEGEIARFAAGGPPSR